MLPFDLHVLGLPPAFTLSQDQTLHLNFSDRSPNALSAVVFTSSKLLTAFACFELTWFCSNVCKMDNHPLARRPHKSPAHTVKDRRNRPQRLIPFYLLNSPQKRPSEPHIIGSFSLPSTPFLQSFRRFSELGDFESGIKNRVPALIGKPRLHCRRGFGIKTLAMTYSRMLSAHYHRRVRVSLPSSGWDRVVPRSYCHQGEGGGSPLVP